MRDLTYEMDVTYKRTNIDIIEALTAPQLERVRGITQYMKYAKSSAKNGRLI